MSALQTLNNVLKHEGILNKKLSDIERPLSEVNFDQRQLGLKQKQKGKERILPFVTTNHPAVQDLKKTLMAN